MKKKLFAILSVFAALTISSACSLGGNSSHVGSGNSSSYGGSLPDDSSATGDSSPNDPSDSGDDIPDDSSTAGSSSGTSTPDGPEWSDDNAVDWTDPDPTPDDENDPPEEKVRYTAFTEEEKALFTQYVGEVIPFLPNYGYSLSPRIASDPIDYSQGLYFSAKDNTNEEFDEYRAALTGYTLVSETVDDYGDIRYTYQKDNVVVETVFYYLNGSYYVDVCAYNTLYLDDTDGYQYADFTGREKNTFLAFVGEVIPFLPTDEYYLEGYDYDDPTDLSQGLCFYTYDNTPEDFAAYREKLGAYTLLETYRDSYGDTWYVYQKGTVNIEACGYYTDSDYYGRYYTVEIYVRNSAISGESQGNVGNKVPDDAGEEGSETPEAEGLMTNAGKGLPTGENGIFAVDFTKAAYAKNVTEQGYYLEGCPTVGNVNALVIPVEFSDATAASKGYSLEKIDAAFNGKDGSTDYFSVSEYYSIASYGKLSLSFTVPDEWFRPQNTSDYYLNAKIDYFGEQVEGGDLLVLDEALSYLSAKMDLSAFDSDQNGFIDAVVMVNTLAINADVTMQWAYRYWNIYADEQGEYFEYDGVIANDYLWAPYPFLLEGYDDSGDLNYLDSRTNTYTFLHEFGHVLGADDYYDTAYVSAPMDGCDIMDGMLGDHNPYTKFHYGWLTSAKLIVAEDSLTVDLTAFDQNGDSIIIANNWDESLGAYQEYYIVAYYRNVGLNTGEGGYFSRDGIVVYHVNATLQKSVENGETYYDVYNNNTDKSDPDGYGTENNLIEFVPSENGTYTYVAGDKLPASTKDDGGNTIAYVFTVDKLDGATATLTFCRSRPN